MSAAKLSVGVGAKSDVKLTGLTHAETRAGADADAACFSVFFVKEEEEEDGAEDEHISMVGIDMTHVVSLVSSVSSESRAADADATAARRRSSSRRLKRRGRFGLASPARTSTYFSGTGHAIFAYVW